MIRSTTVVILILVVLSTIAGCQTYTIEKVNDGALTRGYPFIFKKTYIAKITYTDGTSGANLLSVPTLYGVDVERAAFGLTDASFETSDDGFLKKSTAKVDQKVAENLKAINEVLKTLGVQVAGAPLAPGSPNAEFIPPLPPGKTVQSMTLTPID